MKKLAILFTVALTFIVSGVASLFAAPAGALCDTPFLVGLCEKVQSSLLDILGSTAPELKRTMVGYLQAVTSAQNKAGVTMIPIDPGNGKSKKVRITYLQRGCASDVVTTDNGDCAAEVFKSPLEETIEITQYIATKWMGFNESDMRKLCEADSSYRARVMNSQIDTLMVELNKALITLQNANFGNLSPFSQQPAAYDSCKDVVLLNHAGNGIDYSGEADIIEDFKLLDTTSKPILIGAGKLSKYVTIAKIGCCNQLGQNFGAAAAFDFYHDRFVEGIIGANGFIGLVPGYVQFLTWNKYVGDYRKENDLFAKGTIVDPITGIQLDMEWKYDDCAEQYIMRFKLQYELFFIPVDSFANCDDLSGVNFTLCYTALNAAA